MSAASPVLNSARKTSIRPRTPAHTLRHKAATNAITLATERNKLLLEFLPEVGIIARRIHRRLPSQIPCGDLYQTGVLGLMDAIAKFDPRKNVQLHSYAKFRIRGAILDGLRESDWASRDQRRNAREIETVQSCLTHQLGRTPEQTEIAQQMGLSLDKFHQLVGEIHRLSVGSLDEVAQTSLDGSEQTYGDRLAASEETNPFIQCADTEMKQRIAKAIEQLPENEQRVLSLYYYEELTMQEVGEVLSPAESRISQIHTSAMKRLRSLLQQPGSSAMEPSVVCA